MSLTRDWWLPRLTIRTALLIPASWLFRLAVALRRMLYRTAVFDSVSLPVPVVVVGNLTVGGSGKTPLVIALVSAMRARGYSPGVISRGYGRFAGNGVDPNSPLAVRPEGDASRTGDEPLLIARATEAPVFVAVDRVRAGRALLEAHPEVDLIISDDGLQHYGLARDVDIAVFDERGAGNGYMLPAGPLREPLSRGTGLTALVYNGSDDDASGNGLHQRFEAMHPMKLASRPCYRLTDPEQVGEAARLPMHGPVAAVAGIGNPERFFATLRRCGVAASEHAFPDHHAYTQEDLAAIPAAVIIMTEKDALKCASFGDERIWVLPVAAQIGAAFYDLIQERLRGPKAA